VKIVLFANEQIVDFLLPFKTFGSFRFDEDINEENKLINVEAQNNNWILKSTPEVKVYDIHGNYFEKVVLEVNVFYILEREGRKNLIYTENIFDNSFVKYKYNKQLNLIVGKSQNCNIFYDNELVKGELLSLKYENEQLTAQISAENLIYINQKKPSTNKIDINFGDIIQLYGVKMILLNGVILINNPNNKIYINELVGGIEPFIFESSSDLINSEIKEKELYNENEYFSKSPRLRRTIQSRTIKIDEPPQINEERHVPMLYTVGPMITMAMYSVVNLVNTLIRISSGETTFSRSWTTLMISVGMMCTTLLWPNLTKKYTKKQNKKQRERNIKKYREYLAKIDKDLEQEVMLQKEILNENLISTMECYNMAINQKMGLWSRRIEQDDFLTVRLGLGEYPLAVDFNIPEEGFSVEDNVLLTEALDISRKHVTLQNAPIGYSFLKKTISAMMGPEGKAKKFIENIIVQLVTFHSYEDLKIVFLTNKKNEQRWEFIKYLPHNFSNDKKTRFFATNFEEAKSISSYLELVMNSRKNGDEAQYKPYYLIITDDYSVAKKTNLIKKITETNDDYGFRIIIFENKLGKLPSKCNNFISIGEKNSSVLEDSYENQKITDFNDEIIYNLDMNILAKMLLNIPIEFEKEKRNLPSTISFLEMYDVGKVEQLNIISRWKENDSTLSLKSEIGIDENGDVMFLDIHEKYHGPHGLIAGMTGSGKSEFIITYVLSMATNYSPNDVSFILIDYKGGGLAGAFENKTVGSKLPHLAGTITNLDKAEMNRTLVSIDSEIRRRQMLFNEARELLRENTIDIYKYQRFFKEGRLTEPIPHLIIICDEFAELKSQQPEFMNDLISIARIGRSLGVHLILATQKPAGVVNDQIWSNSKFRVCLKVQEAADSKEMLKRPEAATLKQVGRFYLQVGYDELFVLGQSAWCGAKYYPSEKVRKIVDKSVNFINNIGNVYKSAMELSDNKLVAQGEELNSILNHIIEAAKLEKVFAKNLWLENIPEVIYVDDVINKYNIQFRKNIIEAIIGEYDDPNNQSQGILKIDLNNEGNTLVYGSIGSDREMFLDSLLYSTTTRHSVEELNYYIIDYGSESLRKFKNFPHVGDIIVSDEQEKLTKLINMVKEIVLERKQLFANYGGEYNNYIKQNNSLPLIGILINNYDAFAEYNPMVCDELISITRDCQRYGIFFVITSNNDRSIKMKLKQNFTSIFALRFNDSTEYGMIFGRTNVTLKEIPGRGIFKDKNCYEYQTAYVAGEQNSYEYFNNTGIKLKQLNKTKAKSIPMPPDIVDVDFVQEYINGLDVPVGIDNNTLNITKYDFTSNLFNQIVGNKIENVNSFSKALVILLSQIKNIQLIVVDVNNIMEDLKNNIKYYYSKDPEKIIDMLTNYLYQLKNTSDKKMNLIIYFNNFSDFVELIPENLMMQFTNTAKGMQGVFIISTDEHKKIKKHSLTGWYMNIKNNSSGIWIGPGFEEQSIFKHFQIPKSVKDMMSNKYGFIIDDNNIELFKALEYNEQEGGLNGK